jgi:hypothetical protein
MLEQLANALTTTNVTKVLMNHLTRKKPGWSRLLPQQAAQCRRQQELRPKEYQHRQA